MSAIDTRLEFLSSFFTPSYKMPFINRLDFSCFADFFVRIIKTRVEYGFLFNSSIEGTVNSMERKTLVILMSKNSISGLSQTLQAPQQALPVQDSLGHPTAPPFKGLHEAKFLDVTGTKFSILESFSPRCSQ